MGLLILYLMFLLILGFITAYMWLNRNHLLGLNLADSRRLTHWAVPCLGLDSLFTAIMLFMNGPNSFGPIIGLILGGLILPIIGLIIVQRNFD